MHFDSHLPYQDGDNDTFSGSEARLRGSDWRGKDCDDKNSAVYVLPLPLFFHLFIFCYFFALPQTTNFN